MAFAHITGTATSRDNLFAILESCLVGTVGWAVESGSGTQDIVYSSDGEAADKTKLFVHLDTLADPNTQYLIGTVQDDAVGTNETSAAYLILIAKGELPFKYWITANKDAIMIVTKFSYYYNTLYLGLVEPFAYTPPDETYHCIAGGSGFPFTACRVLRGGDDAWNQAREFYDNIQMTEAMPDPSSGYLAVGGCGIGVGIEMVGTPYFISGAITDNTISPEDTFVSERAGATSTWIVFNAVGARFALLTSNPTTLPAGYNPNSANFMSTRYIINDIDHFFVQLRAFLAQTGWSETDISGASGNNDDWVFSSTGELGTDTVFIRVSRVNNVDSTNVIIRAQTDATNSPANITTLGDTQLEGARCPCAIYFYADLDLFGWFALYNSYWYMGIGGLTLPLDDDLPDSTYKTFVMYDSDHEARGLRGHDGTWNVSLNDQLEEPDDPLNDVAEPNMVDGVTEVLWPDFVYEVVISDRTTYGRIKYLFHRNTYNSSNGDEASDPSGRDYTILYALDTYYAIRTDTGVFSSSSCSSSLSSCSSSFSSSSFSSSSFSSSSFSSSSSSTA